MSGFTHQRHKAYTPLPHPRPLVVAVPPLRSHVNLSRIVRTAGCCGVRRVIACGRPRIDRQIARNSVEYVRLETHRSLPPVLRSLREEGFQLVGLEQTTGSISLYEFRFPHRTALVLGHERQGMTDDVLGLLDVVVEIPVYGPPHSLNVATAASIAMYEYCRQYPAG